MKDMLDINCAGAASDTGTCTRAVTAMLPNIPLLSLDRGEISLKHSRDLFQNRKVMLIGELLPEQRGGAVEQLMRDYVVMQEMMRFSHGVEEAYCLSRINPMLLTGKTRQMGLEPFPFTLLTDTAGCFSAFLEAEGCLPVRASMSNAAAFAVIVQNNHIEHLFVQRSDPTRPTGLLPGCAGCALFAT